MTRLEVKYLRILEENEMPSNDGVECVSLGQGITLAPLILIAISNGQYNSLHHDLLILCAAIEYADRRWQRPLSWSRTFCVTVPVHNLKEWQRPEVLNTLACVLRHLTCDDWHFKFEQAKNLSSCEGQIPIVFRGDYAIAYSEGLDSHAVGALSAVSGSPLRIRLTKPTPKGKPYKTKPGEDVYAQFPFFVTLKGRETSFRTRAFLFAAVTAIGAHAGNFSRVVVPESGQGVLSPAILPLHRTYPDYRNHPTFFRKMEYFISGLLRHEVKYEQPRLWFTKGQTMKAFLELQKKPDELIRTRSCWQSRHIVNYQKKQRQCGLCAACILRRFSLHSVGIDEPPDTYIVSDLQTSSANKAMALIAEEKRASMLAYGSAGVQHFQHFGELAKLSDSALLLRSPGLMKAISSSEKDTLKNLRELFGAHAEEWHAFVAAQGKKSFLLNWMDGGNRWSI